MAKLKLILFLSVITFLIFTTYNYFFRGFYTNTNSNFDLLRIPLIYPFEIISTDSKTWFDMYDSQVSYSDIGLEGYPLQQIDSIGINNNSIIYYYSKGVISKGRLYFWLVFNLNSDTLICCESHEFCWHRNFKMYSPDKLYEDYFKGGSLPKEWTPHIEAYKKKIF